MEINIPILIGVVYAASLYLILRRSIIKLVFGLALLGHASNLLLMSVGGIVRGAPPLINPGEVVLSAATADPLPQALVLTAIVIGFGVQAFALILVRKVYSAVQSDDLDDINTTDT